MQTLPQSADFPAELRESLAATFPSAEASKGIDVALDDNNRFVAGSGLCSQLSRFWTRMLAAQEQAKTTGAWQTQGPRALARALGVDLTRVRELLVRKPNTV